ncbi:MAG: sensor domain-containing diguanylate cyclase [Acidobacteriota bacterium]|nr:sensor domain-containing diguanylate cyclase [Blastocatellia bacterium]MDW8412153.1 sensor domain-containing diguanylate cyclase [Acidobacteriota bacterium]
MLSLLGLAAIRISSDSSYLLASLTYLLLTLICFFLRYDSHRSIDQHLEEGVILSAALALPKEFAVLVMSAAAVLNTVVLIAHKKIRKEPVGGWLSTTGQVFFQSGLLAFTTLTGATVFELFKVGGLQNLFELKTFAAISATYLSILCIRSAVSLAHEWFRGAPISMFLIGLRRLAAPAVFLSEFASILIGVAMATTINTSLSVYLVLALVWIALIALLSSQEAVTRRMQSAIVEMKLLNSLGKSLGVGQTRVQLLEKVESGSLELFGADKFSVYFVNGDGTLQSTSQSCEEFEQALVRWIATYRSPINLKDLTVQLHQYGVTALSQKSKSWLGAAMEVSGKLLGVLCVSSEKKYAFDEQHIELLEGLARQLVIALENARLYELATIDGLTGLVNARQLRLILAELFDDAVKSKEPISLIMLDIDHFKKVNDTYGHEAGNDVLRHVASLLKSHTREKDVSARYGGEEFTIILPKTNLELALKVAHRLRAAVENSLAQTCEGTLRVTSSLGVASYPEHDVGDADTLLSLADKALYRSKQSGRNRVTSASEL